MVNYKGPKKEFSDAEKKELTTFLHSHGIDPKTGDIIIEELPRQPAVNKRMQEIQSEAKNIKNYYADNPQYRPLPKTIFDVDKDKDE